MRLVEITKDYTIIDGVCLKMANNLDFNIKTVYWDESVKSGFVEMLEGEGRVLSSLEEFEPIVKSFTAIEEKPTGKTLRIIPEDRVVCIDGVCRELDISLDPEYHAVQWNGESGVVETKNGLNFHLKNLDEFGAIIEAFNTALEQEKVSAKEKERVFNLPENRIKREIEALERQITPRRIREAMLTEEGKAWLTAKEKAIAEKRAELS